jgi:hypothetical protein
VDAIVASLDAVLIEDSSTDPTANGILGFITIFGNDLPAWRFPPYFSQTNQTLSWGSS